VARPPDVLWSDIYLTVGLQRGEGRMPSVIKAGVKAESRAKLLALWKASAAKEAARAARDAAALGAGLEAAQGEAREGIPESAGRQPKHTGSPRGDGSGRQGRRGTA
jgi:hypothetical protein